MKKCKECGEFKKKTEFYGIQGECKECTKGRVRNNPKQNYKNKDSYDKTEKGVIRVIYKTQRGNSKRRGHSKPDYSKEYLSEFMYKNGFKKIYKEWVKSGYEKKLKPSIDRIDDYKPYTKDNIRLTTWGENKLKQTTDMLKGRSTSGEKCMRVYQLTLDGKHIKEFISQADASRKTGVCSSGISSVIRGNAKTAGGYIWEKI